MATMAGVSLSNGVLTHFTEVSRAQVARAEREEPPMPAPVTEPPRLAKEVHSLAHGARRLVDLRV